MADHVVTAIRTAVYDLDRPLTPREAALALATIYRAARIHADTEDTPSATPITDVVADLSGAVADTLTTGDPAPAVQAIRRLLTDVTPGQPTPEPLPAQRPLYVDGALAASEPAEYRERITA